MKEKELREAAECARCHKKIGASGLPLFWRVRIERYGLDVRALERQQGLAMIVGSAALAQVLGPDEDLATPVMDPVTVTICESCCTEPLILAAIAERDEPKAPIQKTIAPIASSLEET
jgi:hypothetical protein